MIQTIGLDHVNHRFVCYKPFISLRLFYQNLLGFAITHANDIDTMFGRGDTMTT